LVGFTFQSLDILTQDHENLETIIHTQISHLQFVERFLLGGLSFLLFLIIFWFWQERIHRKKMEVLSQDFHNSLLTLEAERGNLSRELHDTVSQELVALKILLSQVPFPMEQKDKLHGIIDKAQGQLRQIAQGLRPPLLDTLGFLEALKYLCDTFILKSGIRVILNLHPMDSHILTNDRGINLYRVVQEALMNSWKHAQAKIVRVNGMVVSDRLLLDITDDGNGMDSLASHSAGCSPNLGLSGMKERAQLLRATLVIKSDKGSGTSIHLEVPL